MKKIQREQQKNIHKSDNENWVIKTTITTVAALSIISVGMVFAATKLSDNKKAKDASKQFDNTVEENESTDISDFSDNNSESQDAFSDDIISSPLNHDGLTNQNNDIASDTDSEDSEKTDITSEIESSTESNTETNMESSTEINMEGVNTSVNTKTDATEKIDTTENDSILSSELASNTDAKVNSPASTVTYTSIEDVPEGKFIPEMESVVFGGKATKKKKKPSTSPISAETTDAAYQVVSGDYFDDAAFIGNSRTEGLMLFTDISGINLAYTGLNVSSAYSTPAKNIKAKDKNGETITEKVPVMEAMRHEKFSKAYIMFGVNEVGWIDADTFISYYRQIITDVREVNPDTIVYVQSMIPVTAAFEKERGDITNAKIAVFNQRLKALAEEQGAYFLNVAECIADKKGILPAEASPDGFHMNAGYYEKWYTYLKEHAIVE